MTKKQKRIKATLVAIYAGATGGCGEYVEVADRDSCVSIDGVETLARFVGGVRAYYGIKADGWPFGLSDLAEWDRTISDLAVWLDETFDWEER